MKRLLISISALCALFVATHANAQTLEEQLRSQLADARSQLQDLQGQQAQWQAQKAQLEQERDAARKEADAAKAQAAKNTSGSSQDAAALASERTAHEQAEAQVQQLRKQVADADAKEHAQEERGGDLTTQLNTAQAQVGTCTAKNQQLYKIGNEILDAYSHMGLGTVLASREPFAASERVKLENAAQAYGDQLYGQRYDPRATTSVKKP
jgi:DNA repair exonuclease SbcCD ATPase subunit